MNRRIILVALIAVLSIPKTWACDVCGCSLSGLYFGYVSMQNRHFIGLKYSSASFKAYIDNDDYYFQDEYSNDTYQRFDLTGKYRFSPRFEVRYVVPYIINNMEGSHQNVRSSGLGDPMIVGYYSIFNTGENIEGIVHSLNVGAGLKLPVGEFEKTDDGEIINRNFQLGSGSLDYILSANYMVRFGKYGANVESSYKINSANSMNYEFGNQANVALNVYRYLETASFSVLPFVGAFYEQGDYHYNEGIREANTGGKAIMATLGAQIFVNRLTLNAQYQTPIKQTFNTDDFASIEGGDRFSIGLYYSL
ncbi:hypothetical protein [uncultured Roseivirga sp.]|jgi:hypothetical protein|uniref:hypothetical protein n=1 Tax=uncultured Roseivirga sp. TaxID=543088 RepID=UPI000D792758|nr:hypothetical protein [uncultured Roseivirga sp.]PWL31723.1 MAG: hypothetical protein DCO95_00625 [Roseivirga sp. XM-24bin3]